MPPVMMLVILKGCEAFGESLPEAVMQGIVLLQLDPERITMTLIIGIISSLLSAGVLSTEGTTGLDATMVAGSPNNPYYGFMSVNTNEWRKAFFGLYVFHIFFFLSTS